MTFTDFIKWLGAILSGVVGYLFGAGNEWLYALIAFVILDYITGLIAAVIEKKLSSSVGFMGILKKLLYLIIVSVGHLADSTIGLNGALELAVVGFLIANEGISILENCGRAGLPIPTKLLIVLKQLKDEQENK